MPYVSRDRRILLDAGAKPLTVGELTYCLTMALKSYLDYYSVSYGSLAECLGALEGAKADLIERILKPYEETKCEENGDCWK